MFGAKEEITEYSFTSQGIDEVSEKVAEILSGLEINSRDIMRHRLTVEECLIDWQEGASSGEKIKLITKKGPFSSSMDIEAGGKIQDPFVESSGDFGSYGTQLLVSMGLSPEYSSVRQPDGGAAVNRLHFKLSKKPMGQLTQLVLVIMASLIAGIVGVQVIPEGMREAMASGFIVPLYGTFFNIIGTIAGPLIFLSVIWGIYGIGDAKTFGKVGRKMMLTFISLVFIAATAALIWAPVIGPGISEGASGESQFSKIVEMIIGIIPSTIVQPFSDGNTLQIIFMAIVFGLSLLFLGKQTSKIAEGVGQLNTLIQYVMSFVCKLVPFFIFFILLDLIWSGSFNEIAGMWKTLLAGAAVLLLNVTVYFLYTKSKHKIPAATFIRKIMPVFLITISTASSSAAFNTNVDTCENGYGISKSVTGFGVPLCMVIQKMNSASFFLIVALSFAEFYGVECSVSWYIMAVIVCSIMAVAMPPVVGGAAASYLIIFTQLGIPKEAVAVALAIDMLMDFFITSAEMICLQFSMINVSSDVDMIDKKVLRA